LLIAIATLGDWLKESYASFSTNEKQNQKPKPFVSYARDPSRASRKSQAISRNSYWFISLSVPVGSSYYFGSGFLTVI